MATIGIGSDVCTAIAGVLNDLVVSGDLNRIQNYDELTEGMNTLPTLQVYPERWEVDIGGETDRTTFTDAATAIPGVRQTEVIIRLDLYVRQRSQLNEDWGEAVDLADTLSDKLDEQSGCPLFDQVGIRSMHWTCQRVVFEYATVLYTGFRFELTIRIF